MTREELRDYVEEQRNLDIIPYHVYSTLIDGIDTLEQQPCEDAISRADAIKTAIEAADDWDGGYNLTRADIIEKASESLPPVQPKTETITEFADRCRECGKQKKGRWIKITPSGIYMCSECEQNVLTGDIDTYHYCHHCGVKMITEGENHENQNEC